MSTYEELESALLVATDSLLRADETTDTARATEGFVLDAARSVHLAIYAAARDAGLDDAHAQALADLGFNAVYATRRVAP